MNETLKPLLGIEEDITDLLINSGCVINKKAIKDLLVYIYKRDMKIMVNQLRETNK